MVSEHFPPLNANMATVVAAGINNNGSSFNGAQTRSQSSAEPVYFNHSISIRLNDHNFLLWKQQVLAVIRGNRLLKFIKEPPPAEFLTEDDRAHNRVNQIFTDWEVQDQLLVSWLLSSMTESPLTRIVGCNTAQQIWTTLETHFTLQVSSKILEFRMKLQNLKKGTLSLNDYLLKVKQNVDLLASVGETLSDRDHVAAIFKGLPSEYDTFIISTNTRVEEYTVGEIEALLLASESRIEKSGKELDLSANIVTDDQDSMMEANLAWRRFKHQYGRGAGNFGNQFANQFGNRGNCGNEQGYMTGQGSGRGNFHLNRGGRSGVNLNNRVQCQLCLRFGHTAHDYFYQFDKNFTSSQAGANNSSSASNNTVAISQFTQKLDAKFKLRDLGKLRFFLGLEVGRTSKGISVSQRPFTLQLLKDTDYLGVKLASTPMELNLKLSKDKGELLPDPSVYQSLIGKLLYLTITRPEITYVIGAAVKILDAPFRAIAFSWGNLSSPGNKKKQQVVSRSSAEAEYHAMANATSELTWLLALLKDFGVSHKQPANLYCDNTAAIHISENPVYHERTKHVEIDCHFIREKIQHGSIQLLHVFSQQN
uniref:Reverse transcriptase Ty1/copia-type domain-containing protein n=1 Tax=Cannabis sativa TaxID=3483 RepID=A0A803QHI8_CANSA